MYCGHQNHLPHQDIIERMEDTVIHPKFSIMVYIEGEEALDQKFDFKFEFYTSEKYLKYALLEDIVIQFRFSIMVSTEREGP